MLTGMLLHEVPAASPVDAPFDLRSDLQRSVGDVEDYSHLLQDFEHLGLAEPSFITRLASPLGVEGGPVEDDTPGLLTDLPHFEDRGRECFEEGIFPVELPGSRLISRHIVTCPGDI